MSQQDQQVLPSQAQPAASTTNESECWATEDGKHELCTSPDCRHDNSPHCHFCADGIPAPTFFEPLDAIPREQVAQLVASKPWPVVGGEYRNRCGFDDGSSFHRVRSIEGGTVYTDLIWKQSGEFLGSHSWSLDSFRRLAACPEDQSPIPALTKALKAALEIVQYPPHSSSRLDRVEKQCIAALALVGEEVSRG